MIKSRLLSVDPVSDDYDDLSDLKPSELEQVPIVDSSRKRMEWSVELECLTFLLLLLFITFLVIPHYFIFISQVLFLLKLPSLVANLHNIIYANHILSGCFYFIHILSPRFYSIHI